ncbi:ATP-dependent DNA ligase [Microbacterium sp. zg.Y1090]|uniref:DUF7882 family protein n=1 Tax=Microbacterium TaxID=33882 RepID=UPI00214B9ECD|nr:MULTISPECIES: ATP-dependent DNA ligase [unclassified Microbacterium]MCR2812276.1 ATP-dependent DNA ligase [Microbacterium sp. zg.Y1084]MCR2819960.1 ATP-dependent DNA ligase [Microbacterium sp. zg.Y1090]MDL5488192.1 ATP-dependent DNA ligase [Microbacterium sp. zg-Y1211]WIM29309.1 ATP-dependent DNA ligase [Microbacterium sp. zg-Y1090]
MGKFTYNSQTSATFDDRLLAHLQVVIGAKLRRSEGFFFTWREDSSLGGGRTALWIHPGASLTFKFSGSREPRINRAWIDALAATANSPRGLYAVPEPQLSESDVERVLLG